MGKWSLGKSAENRDDHDLGVHNILIDLQQFYGVKISKVLLLYLSDNLGSILRLRKNVKVACNCCFQTGQGALTMARSSNVYSVVKVQGQLLEMLSKSWGKNIPVSHKSKVRFVYKNITV